MNARSRGCKQERAMIGLITGYRMRGLSPTLVGIVHPAVRLDAGTEEGGSQLGQTLHQGRPRSSWSMSGCPMCFTNPTWDQLETEPVSRLQASAVAAGSHPVVVAVASHPVSVVVVSHPSCRVRMHFNPTRRGRSKLTVVPDLGTSLAARERSSNSTMPEKVHPGAESTDLGLGR